MRPLTCVDEVSQQRVVCRAFDEAPHVPVAGASMVPMFNEKLRAGIFFQGDLIALHVMDVFSKSSLSIPVRSKNPQEA